MPFLGFSLLYEEQKIIKWKIETASPLLCQVIQITIHLLSILSLLHRMYLGKITNLDSVASTFHLVCTVIAFKEHLPRYGCFHPMCLSVRETDTFGWEFGGMLKDSIGTLKQ